MKIASSLIVAILLAGCGQSSEEEAKEDYLTYQAWVKLAGRPDITQAEFNALYKHGLLPGLAAKQAQKSADAAETAASFAVGMAVGTAVARK